MTSPIRTEVDFEDGAAPGAEAEAVDRTEGPYYLHQALPNAVAHPTLLEQPKTKSSAQLATETKSGHFKPTFPRPQRTLAMWR